MSYKLLNGAASDELRELFQADPTLNELRRIGRTLHLYGRVDLSMRRG